MSVYVFVCFIVFAHIIAPDSYHWMFHTVSHLGSQGYENKMLMQMGFISFGLVLSIGSLKKSNRDYADWFMAFYALCILFTGIFCTRPFESDVEFNQLESELHSIFATLAGFAFCIAIFIKAMNEKSSRVLHFVFFILVLFLSMIYGISKLHFGLIQKIMYGVSFTWIVFMYRGNEPR
jgi:hypothetical protein